MNKILEEKNDFTNIDEKIYHAIITGCRSAVLVGLRSYSVELFEHCCHPVENSCTAASDYFNSNKVEIGNPAVINNYTRDE